MIIPTVKSVLNFVNHLNSFFNPPSSFLRLNRFQTTIAQPYHLYSDKNLHNYLQKCIKIQTHEALRAFHALVIVLGPFSRQHIYFFNNVVSLYLSFGELHNARKVFDKMSQRNGVSYNALISGYSRSAMVGYAWEVFCGMWGCGFRPTQFSFGALLSCHGLDVMNGCVVYGLMLKNGLFFFDPHGGTALLGLFGRHGCIDEVVRVFNDMPEKSLATWNSIISVLGYHGLVEESVDFFCRLLRCENCFSESTLVGLLSGFEGPEALDIGKMMHCFIIKNGIDYDISMWNALISMYAKCTNLYLAEKLFEEAKFRDVVTYNTMIWVFAKCEMPERGLDLFFGLLADSISPNLTSYVGVINCCAKLRILIIGEYIHAKIMRNSFNHDVYVGSALVDFYGKCDMLDPACRCFDEISHKNVVSWNNLIVACTSNNDHSSYALFREMLRLDYCPDEFTFSAALKASSVVELQELHCLAIRMGYAKNEYVFTALMTSYARNGLLSEALFIATSMKTPTSVVCSNALAATFNRVSKYEKSLQTLSQLNDPDFSSWNILLSTCSHNGHCYEAFELFKHMLEVYIYPDKYTITCILSCCTSLQCLSFGVSVHGVMVKLGLHLCDTFVCNMLMDMYAKCGNIEESIKIFEHTIDRNFITWTTVISALGHHGCARQALARFKEMELSGIRPDGVAFLAVLSACRHGGLVAEGMELFSKMQKEYEIQPKMDHYHGVVDLLARHGHLKEAEKVINDMPFPPNALIWRSFLDGCKRWRNSKYYLERQLT